MKRFLRQLCLLLGLTMAIVGSAQHLVQGVVDGLQDPMVAREASLLLQQQPGILMARFDVPTRNMMLHVVAEHALDLSALNSSLAALGLQVRCFQRRPAHQARFQHLDPDDCGPHPDGK
ncbi:MAG: hypothetical protein MUE88_09595 [Flavobacteriales bacterium]|nr:hypothetical protein [Flavobacteriales bacterium]